MSCNDAKFVTRRFQRIVTRKNLEGSLFYKELCSTTLKVDRLHKLEVEIPILLCKLEKIFHPAFFNVIEHLSVHLPFEARLRGPVQYGWMYPFERYVINTEYVNVNLTINKKSILI